MHHSLVQGVTHTASHLAALALRPGLLPALARLPDLQQWTARQPPRAPRLPAAPARYSSAARPQFRWRGARCRRCGRRCAVSGARSCTHNAQKLEVRNDLGGGHRAARRALVDGRSAPRARTRTTKPCGDAAAAVRCTYSVGGSTAMGESAVLRTGNETISRLPRVVKGTSWRGERATRQVGGLSANDACGTSTWRPAVRTRRTLHGVVAFPGS